MTEKIFFRNSSGFEDFRSCREISGTIGYLLFLIHLQIYVQKKVFNPFHTAYFRGHRFYIFWHIICTIRSTDYGKMIGFGWFGLEKSYCRSKSSEFHQISENSSLKKRKSCYKCVESCFTSYWVNNIAKTVFLPHNFSVIQYFSMQIWWHIQFWPLSSNIIL